MAEIDIRSLGGRLRGRALAPGDDGWDEARRAWNLTADQHPDGVVLAEGVDDVRATVEFAREQGARVAPQSTGHAASGITSLEGTLLLRTLGMGGVEVDSGARRARVEGGAVWSAVAPKAAEHGLVGLSGSAGEVGVVGYTLGGGIGWLSRKHGLACNSVTSFEVVNAEGDVVRTAADSEPDLFWALRGGGGSFGVVTAMEFELYPLAEVYAGMIAWPAARGGDVVPAYLDWIEGLPEEMSAWVRFLTLPPIPQVPEHLRGVPLVDVTAAYAGPEAEGADLIRPLLDLGEPMMNTFATMPAAGLGALNGDPEEPVPGLGDGSLLGALPAEAVDAFVGVAGAESGSPLLSVQLRHLGGALARPADGGGATSSLDAEFALYAVGMAMGPDMAAATSAHVTKVGEALEPWSAGRRYLNFVDVPAPAALSFDDETYERLLSVRKRYDPDDLFRANHEVAPAV
ncbi:MAG: FAD-binding protein [Thermoleophilaceae bacterium]|nr:FAD-binding protein [Thermoleophilaceae bacterium]